MSRPQSLKNYGHYPTQEGIIELLGEYLKFYDIGHSWRSGDKYIVLDPCCSDGQALDRIRNCWFSSSSQVATFGIEIHAKRAAKAALLLDSVQHGDSLEYMLTQGNSRGNCVDLLFLNPPYDAIFDSEEDADRYELMFLDHWLDAVVVSGWFVYVVRSKFLDDKRIEIMDVLKEHQVSHAYSLRYPDEQYQDFQQVVVIGRRETYFTGTCRIEPLGIMGIVNKLVVQRFLGNASKVVPHTIKPEYLTFSEIPSLKAVEPFWEGHYLDTYFGDPGQQLPIQPLAEIRAEHAILLAAAGVLNGLALNDHLVLKGYSKKIELKHQEAVEDGGYSEFITERYVHVLALLDTDTWEVLLVDDYADTTAYENFVLQYGDQLLVAVQRLYTPRYEPEFLARFRRTFDRIKSPKRLPNLPTHDGSMLEAQAHTAAALALGLQNNSGLKVVTLSGEMSVGKTFISLAAIYYRMVTQRHAQKRKLIILVPASHDAVNKWESEALTLLGPLGVTVYVGRKVKDIDRMFADPHPAILIIPETSAKLTSGWENVIEKLPDRWGYDHVEVRRETSSNPYGLFDEQQEQFRPSLLPDNLGGLVEPRDYHGRRMIRTVNGDYVLAENMYSGQRVFGKYIYLRGWQCPTCGEIMPTNVFTTKHFKSELKASCPHCKAPVWRRKGTRNGAKEYSRGKEALGRYIRQQYSGMYDLIMDECFPGNTRIRTIDGDKRIDQIEIGDFVASEQDGKLVYKIVERVLCRPLTKETVRVTHANGSFVCTRDHKIYTQHGKVSAGDLVSGDILTYGQEKTFPTIQPMSILREEIRQGETSQTEVLQSVLCQYVQSNRQTETPVSRCNNARLHVSDVWQGIQSPFSYPQILQQELFCQGSNWRDSKQETEAQYAYYGERSIELAGILGTNENEKPHSIARGHRKDQGCFEGTQALRETRERVYDYSASDVVIRSWGRLGSGTSYRDGRFGLAGGCSGYSQSLLQDCCGGGWEFPQYQTAAGTGFSESCVFEGQGLDFGESDQFRSGQEITGLCFVNSVVYSVVPESVEDEYVYDLTVADTHRYFAEGVLVSNCHLYKSASSARAFSSMDLLAGSRKAIQMTGTLLDGMPSSVFYLMYRADHRFRTRYSYKEVQKFVDVYGLTQTVTRYIPQTNQHSRSGYNVYQGTPKEIPGIHPAMILEMLANTVTLTLPDLGYPLPPYSESTAFVPMSEDLAQAYNTFVNAGKTVSAHARKEGDLSISSLFMHRQFSTLDRPHIEETLSFMGFSAKFDPSTLDLTQIFPKEELFLRIVLEQHRRKRPVLCFVSHMNTADPTGRLIPLLARYGLKGVVMRREEDDRVGFIDEAVADGVAVIFTNPNLVSVSVDLISTPTIIWYGVEYSIVTYQQTNRRPWRLTQTEAVEVYYLAYQQTPQATAFDWVAQKMVASLVFAGRPVDGLAALRGGDTFVHRLQQLILDKAHVTLDSDLTMDSFPPLPDQTFVHVDADAVEVYLPKHLKARWGHKLNVQRWGVCRHCLLDFSAPSDFKLGYWPAHSTDSKVYRFHAECVQGYTKGRTLLLRTHAVEIA